MHQKRVIPDTIRQLCYKRDGNGHCQYPGCSLSKKNGDTVNLHHVQNEQFDGTEDPHNILSKLNPSKQVLVDVRIQGKLSESSRQITL